MNHPSNPDLSAGAPERLNSLWDDATAQDADGEMLDLIHRLHAMDDLPDPDPGFLVQLRGQLTQPPRKQDMPRSRAVLGIAAVSVPSRSFNRPAYVRAAITAFAAALLIAALSSGGQWLPGSGSSLLVASAMASPIAGQASPIPSVTQSPASSPISVPVEDTQATQRVRHPRLNPVVMLHIETKGVER